MPNLMQILSIFLKLQVVKLSGPGFLAYPVVDSLKKNDKDDFFCPAAIYQ